MIFSLCLLECRACQISHDPSKSQAKTIQRIGVKIKLISPVTKVVVMVEVHPPNF